MAENSAVDKEALPLPRDPLSSRRWRECPYVIISHTGTSGVKEHNLAHSEPHRYSWLPHPSYSTATMSLSIRTPINQIYHYCSLRFLNYALCVTQATPVHMAPCEWLEEGALIPLSSHLSENFCELLILLDHNRCLPYAQFFIINSSNELVRHGVWQGPLPGDAGEQSPVCTNVALGLPCTFFSLAQIKCILCHSPHFTMISTQERLCPSDCTPMRYLS